jgi:glycosyltransferase involved in cell wall biosynthesis
MKIAYLLTRSDSVGGASIHVRDLSRTLKEQGHTITVYIGGAGPVVGMLESVGVTCVRLRYLKRALNPLYDGLALIELLRQLKNDKPDLVSCHTSKAGALGRVAAWVLGYPAVYTPHCWSFVEGFPQARWYLLVEKFLMRFSAAVIAVSHWEKELAVKRGLRPEQKIRVIHNAMRESSYGKANPDREPVHLVSVARFEPQKDHQTLVRALARCQDISWRVDFIGDGPDQDRIKGHVEALGLGGRIRFLGACPEVEKRLSEYQGFILCSLWESFPRSILEAMQAGLPVIATDVGGVNEAVRDGVTGRTVPPRDIDQLASALRVLMSEPATRKRWGEAGREEFFKHWQMDTMVRKTVALYESILNGG